MAARQVNHGNRTSDIERYLWAVELLDLSGGESVLEIGCEPAIALKVTFNKQSPANVVQFFTDRDEAFGLIFGALKTGGVCAAAYLPRHKNAARDDAFDMPKELSQ